MNNDSTDVTSSRAVWKRGLFMLVFALIYHLAEAVVFFTVVFQFVYVLVTRTRNEPALELGQGLSSYVYEILQFMTFNSDQLPFPFAPWPRAGGRSA